MKRAKIDLTTPAGTFTTEDGRSMYKFNVTFDDNVDGLVFSTSKTPWWMGYTRPVYYEMTGVTNNTNHIRIRRQMTPVVTPGTGPNSGDRWRTCLDWAVSIMQPPAEHPQPTYFAELEATAIQLEMVWSRLEKTTL
jgi:hypothetical protein